MDGIAEVRVVEDIEKLRTETKPHVFTDVNLALQSKIKLRSSESSQNGASEPAPVIPSR